MNAQLQISDRISLNSSFKYI